MRNPVREVIGDAVVICEAFPRRRGWEVLCSFTRPGKQPVIASHGTWASKDAAFHTMSEVLESIREKWARVANPNGFWPDPTYDPDDEDGDERARVRRRLRVSKTGARRNVIVDTPQIESVLSKLDSVDLKFEKPTEKQLARWKRIEQIYGSQFKVSETERKKAWFERGHII